MPAPAVKGKSEYAVNHGGHVWYFANEENMQKFKESPNAYVPAFGGQSPGVEVLHFRLTRSPRRHRRDATPPRRRRGDRPESLRVSRMN